MSKDTPILQPSDGKKSNPLTSSAEDSPASPSVSLASEKEPPMNDGSGQSLYGALAYYDPATSSLKMCQGCLLLIEDDPLLNSYGTWPRAGTMRNGIVYQQAPLVPLIGETECGLLPTPVKYDATPGGPNNHYKGLGHMAKHKKLPTPTVQDSANNGGPSQYRRNSLPLNAVIGGKLNPMFVEWMMGYPIAWTELQVSATPSSRKSSNG